MVRASLLVCLAGACLGLSAAENPVAVDSGDTVTIGAKPANGRTPAAVNHTANTESNTATVQPATGRTPVVVKNGGDTDANTVIIGANPVNNTPVATSNDPTDTSAVTIGKRERLSPKMADNAFQVEVAKIAKELSAASISKDAAESLRQEIRRAPDRSGAALAKCLDARQYDADTRRGAAKGIALSEANTKTVGKALGDAALIEPDAATRKEMISTIQQRRDPMALHGLLSKLEEASDPEGLGIINEKQRDAALGVLRDIGDKRVYAAVFYYVTMEVRTGYANFGGVDTKFITNSGDVSNGATGRTTVNLPIELPTLELGSFQGTITVPAISQPTGAMKKLTGQDFGKDLVKWQDWIAKQPDVKK